MSSFSYTVINKQGKERKGSIEAANEKEVISLLRAEGNIPISVVPQSIMNKEISLHIGSQVKSRDLSIFCRSIGSILSAGIPIIDALRMQARQLENKALAKVVGEIQMAVEKGETLTNAMLEYTEFFPAIMIHMVEAGETSGSLEIALERLSIHFERETELKSRVKKAMIYPVIVAIVAIGVLVIMMLVVIPNFMGMFESMNMELPFMTRMVMGMSNFFISKWYLILSTIFLFVFVFSIYKKSPTGELALGRLSLKLPLFGSLRIKSASARFARTLGTLLATGIPMMNSLEVAAKTMDNIIVRKVLLGAKEDVSKGLPLSQPLSRSKVFPSMVCDMTKIGEETGNMSTMLNKLADYYDEEVKYATDSLTAAMEPLIIVILALVVGVLIMAMMQPMMSMYKNLGSM